MRPRSGWTALAISVAVHGVLLLVAQQLLPPRSPKSEPIEVTWLEAPAVRAPEPARVESKVAVEPRADRPPAVERARPRAEAPGEARPPEPAPAAARGSTEAPADAAPNAQAGNWEVGKPSFDPLAPLPIRPEAPALNAPRIARGPSGPALAPSGGGTYHYRERGFTADIARDGTVSFDNNSNVAVGGGALLSFDLTEVVMAAAGEDPFTADKLRFLEETRALRLEMCDRARAEALKESIVDLGHRLRRIWSRSDLPAAERRRLLFDLWDECGETEPGDATAQAAAMARTTILAFVRRQLPPGSADAYRPEELLALNERRVSRERFAPYVGVAPLVGTGALGVE
ncbi:MAG: hypothetical protein IT384_21825 [Deltaproteobacteria bacterium]|nr:hypothetical protein [Deltaproteobacteria bacterium]